MTRDDELSAWLAKQGKSGGREREEPGHIDFAGPRSSKEVGPPWACPGCQGHSWQDHGRRRLEGNRSWPLTVQAFECLGCGRVDFMRAGQLASRA